MIVYVLFVHKKYVSKRKVCIIFIKKFKIKKNIKKTLLVGFLGGFFFGWVFYCQPWYQEAFLTTYRTFLTTEALVDKLVYRYRRFCARAKAGDSGESVYRRASRAAFSLLVRVVDGLADMDFQAVFRIPIRIHRVHMFLGLTDPDPLIRGMDPDPSLFS